MWHDNETDKDFLGFVVHEQLIRNVITDDDNLPITVGLYGDWGSGKSSVLKILKKDLEECPYKEDTLVVSFDSWTFEGYDDAKSALMQDIVKQLEDNESLKEEVKRTVKEKAKVVFKSIKWLRTLKWSATNLILPGVVAYATGGFSLVPFLLGKLKEHKDELADKIAGEDGELFLEKIIKANTAEPDYNSVREFRKNFSELIDATEKKRLVVLIDDLDRCSSQRIIENLEAIKLFLNVEKTAFVIAADERIVKDAVYSVYRNTLSDKRNETEKDDIGKEYLDKLIQVPYNLPRLSVKEVETYINLLLCKSTLNPDEFENIRSKFQEFIVKDKFGVFDWGNIAPLITDEDVKGKIFPLAAFMAPASNIIATSLKGNPRLIKRFLNAFELRSKLLEVGGINDSKTRLALLKLMIVERKDENFFKQLYTWQGEKNIEHILKLEELAAKDEEKYEGDYAVLNSIPLKSLINQEPKFSKVDMQSLFWATRATYADAMSGITLVSKAVRELINNVMNDSTTDSMLEKTFVSRIDKLMGADIMDFFDILDQNILSDPAKKKGYDVYYFCVKAHTPNAFSRFKELLKRVPMNVVPASLGSKLRNIIETYSEGEEFAKIFPQNTEIGKSIKNTK